MLVGVIAFVALSLVQATVASPTPISSSISIARARGAVEFNERILVSNGNATQGTLSRRADTAWDATHPGLKASIDGAISRTAAKPHFFWSGRVLPATSNDDSVMSRAIAMAKARGGTTLELTIESVAMPQFAGGDPDREEIWQYASDEYANSARGDVYFVKGETLRSGNVWEAYEYPRLKKSTSIKRILQILTRKTGSEQPKQIWPETTGCDGVFLLDRHLTCPAGSKLYYSTAQKLVVTAKTTTADAVIKVSPSGNAPGVARTCVEILTGEFILEVFEESGVCDLATSKGNNGKAMTAVKKLLDSTKNRNYLQQQRLVKITQRVLGIPILPHLKRALIDALVSIDYFEKTQAETAAVTKQIDDLVRAVTGKSPGVTAAWAKKTALLKETKLSLLAELRKQIAEKAKQAKETKDRKDACGAPLAPTGPKPTNPKPPRMVRRSLSLFSPAPLSALERRAPKAPRSGAKAPAAPSCPLPGAKPKQVVPRDKLKEKPTPAKKPRLAQRTPKANPPAANKKTVKRPASRPRRQPGKAAPKKRITPKKQPRKVPRPAKKPKGKARPRRGRR